jgi:hypothetical protein
MERDPVALAVEDDRAIAVRADLMHCLDDPAAVAGDGANGIGEPAVGVEVDERAALARRVVVVGGVEAAGDVVVAVRKDAEREARPAFAVTGPSSTAE